MSWIVEHVQWIMVGSGLLTCTMVQAAIAPDAAMRATFGETADGPAARIVVRNWGVLITLVGTMLIYGAFHPAVRPLVLAVAAISKAVFVALVLAAGRRYLRRAAGVAIAIDLVAVGLFALLLAAPRS